MLPDPQLSYPQGGVSGITRRCELHYKCGSRDPRERHDVDVWDAFRGEPSLSLHLVQLRERYYNRCASRAYARRGLAPIRSLRPRRELAYDRPDPCHEAPHPPGPESCGLSPAHVCSPSLSGRAPAPSPDTRLSKSRGRQATLVSEWLSHQEWSAAWVSLDRGDSDPRRFFRYVVAALHQATGDVNQGAAPPAGSRATART